MTKAGFSRQPLSRHAQYDTNAPGSPARASPLSLHQY